MGSGRGQHSGGSLHGIRLFFSLPEGNSFFHAYEPLCPSNLFCMLVLLCTVRTSNPLRPGQLTSGSMPCYCLSCLLCVPFWTLRYFSTLFLGFLAKRKICLEVPKILPGSFLLISFSVLAPEYSSILKPFCGWNTFLFVCVVFDFYGYLPTHDQGGYILLNTWTI